MNDKQIQKLTQYYIHNYPKRRNLTISDIHEITDGWETKLHKYKINYILNEKPVSDQHVIRIFSDNAGYTSEKEYQVMRKLGEQGYPVPKVYHNELWGDVLSTPFIVMEYLSGNTMDHRFHNVSDSEREELYKQMIELMFELHKVKVSKIFPENKLLDTDEYLCDIFSKIEERINQTKFYWVSPVVDWLKEKRVELEIRELCVLHGDFHGRNIMYRENGTTAVIDWSGVHVGDYRFDLAWTVIHVFSSFLNKPDEMGVVTKTEAMTPEISDHFQKVYDMLVNRTGLTLPEFEKILSN
jgi:aminoglycoside phosphotransferase (APT) family kinase protein